VKRTLLIVLGGCLLLLLASCGSPTTITTKAASTTTTVTAVDKVKFAAVWADFKAIEAATEVGVTYINFAPLVARLQTDISLMPSTGLTAKETDILDRMAAVEDAYGVSRVLWESSIKAEEGEPVVCTPEAAAHFGLTTTTGKFAQFTYVDHNAFKDMWAWASRHGNALAPDLAP
jgi:hypothetical protein